MTVDFYELLDGIVEDLKDAERTFKSDKRKGKTPHFYPTYKDTVDVQEAIAVHADYNVIPEKLFREKAPNETPPEFEYRKSIYQPITVPYFHKAMNVTGRVWNEQNYDIKWPEQSEKQQDYFYKEYPYWGNLEAFFKQVVSPTTCTDPNAVIVHCPVDLAFTESGDFDDTKEVTPIAELYDATRVWAFKHDKYCIVRAYEDADVTYGSKDEKGIVLWMFDTDSIYKATQIGKKIDYKFDIQLYYQHNMGLLPCKRLGGIPVQDEDRFYYQSFFSPAIPALNIALCDSSTLAMSKYAHAFLQKWEYVDECDTCGGKGTEEYYREGFEEKVARVCSGCSGVGKKTMFSPMSVYQVKAPNGMASGGASKTEMNIPPAGFIDLNPEILTFLEKQITTNLQRAFELLSIDVMNNESVSGRETATGKAIDREELYSFLLKFAECVFGTLEFSFKCIGTMRYGDSWLAPSIRYPQTFEIRTDAEITEELQKAPTYAQKMLALQYLDARFPIQDAKADRMKLSIKLDPLFGKTDTDIAKSVGVGATPKWKYALHNEVNYFIDLAIEQNENFMELDIAAQRLAIENLAKAAVPADTALTPDSILNQLT